MPAGLNTELLQQTAAVVSLLDFGESFASEQLANHVYAESSRNFFKYARDVNKALLEYLQRGVTSSSVGRRQTLDGYGDIQTIRRFAAGLHRLM